MKQSQWRDAPSGRTHDLNSNKTSSEACTYNPLLKILEKCLINLCQSSKYLSLCAILYNYKNQIRSKWSTVAISGQELPSLHFSVLIDFKNVSTLLWVTKYSSTPHNLSLTDKTLQVFYCSVTVSMESVETNHILATVLYVHFTWMIMVRIAISMQKAFHWPNNITV